MLARELRIGNFIQIYGEKKNGEFDNIIFEVCIIQEKSISGYNVDEITMSGNPKIRQKEMIPLDLVKPIKITKD